MKRVNGLFPDFALPDTDDEIAYEARRPVDDMRQEVCDECEVEVWRLVHSQVEDSLAWERDRNAEA